MANTTNLDLVKPAGTDHALISVLNSNSDKIDAFAGQTNDSLSAEQNGLAYIVGNTNTTGGTLAVGQFVYVKGHSTIAEGLRKVTASISANGSITTSNTDACSEGGLNALNSKINKFAITIASDSNVTYIKSGNVVQAVLNNITSASFTIPSGYRPYSTAYLPAVWDTSGSRPVFPSVNSNGDVIFQDVSGAVISGTVSLYGSLHYIVEM